MKRTSLRTYLVPSLAALALGLSGCAAGNEPSSGSDSGSGGSGLSGTIAGAGASSQESAQQAWQAGFQGENPDVTVNYDPVGSGGGREQFLEGGVDFAASDSYMDDEELEASKEVCNGETAIETPNYVSPIALVYNLEGVDDLTLSAPTVAGIFTGEITTWDDEAIAEDNPDADLPSDRIVPVHRADDSGTTDNFTQYLAEAADGGWSYEPDGVWPLKSGESAQGTSGLVDAVKSGAGSIGYADASQAGDLSVAKLMVGEEAVEPTAEAAAKIVDVSPRVEGRAENDLAIEVARTTDEPGAYPLVLVSYVIACPTYSDETKAELVKGYLSYVVGEDGQAAAAENAGSAPLSQEFSADGLAAIEKIAAAS